MEIKKARTAGFCFGVRRAIEMVEAALEDKATPLYSLGPLIHNPGVVRNLESRGLHLVGSVAEIPNGRVVIRSHGAGPNVYREATDKGLSLIDATCPFVKNVQQLAILLRNEGYQVIIYGQSEHAEVQGVLDSIDGQALVINEIQGFDAAKIQPKVGLLSQTTQEISGFGRLVTELIPLTKELRVFNTICLATSERQAETAELSSQVDLMLVVGGHNSANTSRLAEISRKNCPRVFQIEKAEELHPQWLDGVERIGVTAGASTPDEQIQEVVAQISDCTNK